MEKKMTKDEEKWIVRVVGIFVAIIIFAFFLGMALMYGWLAINHQIIALEEEAATQILQFLL